MEETLESVLADAAKRGVKICVVVYNAPAIALALYPQEAKRRLESLSDNISVILHPRQLGENAVLSWSHHQKLVLIDHRVAFVGGLDICLGRYDDTSHRLYDGGEQSAHTFPGCDYANPCTRDVVPPNPIHHPDVLSRLTEARLPWHDVHCLLEGAVVADIGRHFVQLWNHVRTDMHKNSSTKSLLQLLSVDQDEQEEGGEEEGGGGGGSRWGWSKRVV
jgi:phospholipase D1/2